MNRRLLILLGLLAATVLLALVLGLNGGGGAGDALMSDVGRGSSAGRDAQGAATASEVVALQSAPLDDVPSEYEPGRNPFRFYQPPKPPPEPTPEPEPRPDPEPVEPAPAPDPAPQGPRPPPIELDFLGSFGPEERPIAVFTDGEQIHNVRLGDVIDGKFRVIRVGYESVDLAFVDFPEVPAERLPIGRTNGG